MNIKSIPQSSSLQALQMADFNTFGKSVGNSGPCNKWEMLQLILKNNRTAMKSACLQITTFNRIIKSLELRLNSAIRDSIKQVRNRTLSRLHVVRTIRQKYYAYAHKISRDGIKIRKQLEDARRESGLPAEKEVDDKLLEQVLEVYEIQVELEQEKTEEEEVTWKRSIN